MGAVVRVTRVNKAAERRRRYHERRVAAAKGHRARLTEVWNWWLAEFDKATDASRDMLIGRLHAEARQLNTGGQE